MAFLNKLFGKKDNEKDKENIVESEICADEDELTDEEIEAASRMEDELRDEIVNNQTLDYDGDFIETDIDTVEDEKNEETEIEEAEETEEIAEEDKRR